MAKWWVEAVDEILFDLGYPKLEMGRRWGRLVNDFKSFLLAGEIHAQYKAIEDRIVVICEQWNYIALRCAWMNKAGPLLPTERLLFHDKVIDAVRELLPLDDAGRSAAYKRLLRDAECRGLYIPVYPGQPDADDRAEENYE